MNNHLTDKKIIGTDESLVNISSVIKARTWNTPKLTEMDYSQTNENAGPGSDDSFTAS